MAAMTTRLSEQVVALQRRLDDAAGRAERLRRAIESISGELALKPLLTDLIQRAVELIGATNGVIGLVLEQRDGLILCTAAGCNLPRLELDHLSSPDVGIVRLVLQEQRPIRLDHYRDLADLTLPERDNYAILGLPIWWADRIIGFFNIGAAPPRRFDDQDVATMELLARHAAIAIENARRYEREQHRSEQLTLIARIGRSLTADLQLDELLQSAADSIHELLVYPNVAIALIDPADPTTMVLRTFGGAYRTMVGGEHHLPISAGIMGAAARTRQTQLVNDVASDPRFILPPGAVGTRAELAVPMVSGGEVLGVLNLESSDPFYEDDATTIQIVADQLAVAIENAQLAERGQQLAVLEERRRLARELHDSVTQSLFSMSLLAQALPELWEVDQAEARAGLRQIRDLTRSALTEMRALLIELRPAGLANRGLAHAIREHVSAFEQRTGLLVILDLADNCPLPEPVEQAFFRIAQEALANVARHAQARRVRLTLSGQAPVRLQIADDGRGFQPERVGDGCFGLLSMRERAAAAGARLHVRATAGRGTEIIVEWPAPDQDDHFATGEPGG
jgi:signal transduction histidine kinase